MQTEGKNGRSPVRERMARGAVVAPARGLVGCRMGKEGCMEGYSSQGLVQGSSFGSHLRIRIQ